MQIFFFFFIYIKAQEYCFKNLNDFYLQSYVRNIIQFDDKLYFNLQKSKIVQFDYQQNATINEFSHNTQQSIKIDMINLKNQKYIIALYNDGYIYIIGYFNQIVLRYAKVFDSRPNGFIFDQGTENLIIYGNDKLIKIFSFNTLNQVGVLQGHNGFVLSITKIDQIYISGGTDKKLFIWNSQTFKQIDFLYGFTSFIKNIQYFKENKILLGFGDGSVMIFDYIKKGYKDHLKLHQSDIDHMIQAQIEHQSKVRNVLVTGDLQGNINFLDLDNLLQLQNVKNHRDSVKQIYYLQNNIFITTSKDGNIKFFSFGCYQIKEEL